MEDVNYIHERNARVEADKAWETSWSRRVIIAGGTYIVIGGYLTYLNVKDAWLHAVVPAVAYILSTLTLKILKQIWIKRIYQNDQNQ